MIRMKKNLILGLVLSICAVPPFHAQISGYFGKKNFVSIHGSWFFDGLFFPEKAARPHFYNARNESFSNSFLRQHNLNAGFSYQRLVSEREAIGIQVETGLVNLPTGEIAEDFGNAPVRGYYLSEGLFVDRDAVSSRLRMLKNDFLLTYAITRTLAIFPLGFTTTMGLGMHQSRMLLDPVFIRGDLFQTEVDADPVKTDQLFRLDPLSETENSYSGVSWFCGFSVNYALNSRFLLSLGTEFRGSFFTRMMSSVSSLRNLYKNEFPSQSLSIEERTFARDLSRQLNRETVFQNKLRIGLTFAF